MWRATTDDEANFIFDLLAERDTTEAVERYARWLDGRDTLRAEFLRLDTATMGNQMRLHELRQQLDQRWLSVVTSRRFRVGDNVRILSGVLAGIEGSIREVDAEHGRAGLWLHLFYWSTELTWVSFVDLLVIKRANRGPKATRTPNQPVVPKSRQIDSD